MAVLCTALLYVNFRARMIADIDGAPLRSEPVLAQLQSELGPVLALAATGVLLLPVFIGVFAGVPLVSREVEDSTHRLVWTQSLSRDRWFFSKVGLLAASLALAAALISTSAMLGGLAVPSVSGLSGRFASFDAEFPVLFGWALLAFGLGVLLGALVRRALPALLATILAYTAIRVLVTAGVRSQYLPPLQALNERDVPAAAWQLPHRFLDGSGREVDASRVSALIRDFGAHVQEFQGNMARYLEVNGVFQPIHYQPEQRYWVFQGMETLLAVSAALVCLALALIIVRRLPA